ncbi:MAG TPA: DUF6677 family protein [Gemmatimonadaceae bacterium]|nr:DUF6677 family protein [Gemmatimonadaceae bacterium]
MMLASMATKSTTADRARASAEPGSLALLCVAAWLVPGAGHLWQGRRQKGLVFLCAIPVMFVLGLVLHGTIFPFQFSEPLSGLAALAEFGTGVPWILARAMDAGRGSVTAATWEYGNTFMIVAGLLNALIVLDAFDIGMGRK